MISLNHFMNQKPYLKHSLEIHLLKTSPISPRHQKLTTTNVATLAITFLSETISIDNTASTTPNRSYLVLETLHWLPLLMSSLQTRLFRLWPFNLVLDSLKRDKNSIFMWILHLWFPEIDIGLSMILNGKT